MLLDDALRVSLNNSTAMKSCLLFVVDDHFDPQMRRKNSPATVPHFLHRPGCVKAGFIQWGKQCSRNAIKSRHGVRLFSVGGCVSPQLENWGNKFGNVSSLRVWAPNEAVPGCSRLVLLYAASHASANRWANKLEMHRRVHIHTCLPSPVPLLSIIQGLWTWQGGKVPQRRGCGCCGQESVCHYYIHSHLSLPSGLLTLLYRLSFS